MTKACHSAICRLAAMALMASLTRHSGAQNSTAKEVYKKTVPSVVVIISLDQNDQPVSLGTGFYVRGDLVATNLHVVRKAKKIRVFGAVDQKERKVKGVHAVSSSNDLAVLTMQDTGDALSFASVRLEPGDSIFAIGNPRGLEATLSTGIVSAVRMSDKTSMYQVSAPISPGSSGGPVLNEKAEVVGIATSYLDSGQNLNFAVDVRHLGEAIASNPSNAIRPMGTLAEGTTPTESRKAVVETVRVVSPEMNGGRDFSTDSYELTWDLSIKNDGDKSIKNVDMLILIYDKLNKEMVHSLRRRVELVVPSKLAKRTTLREGGLNFQTYRARFGWVCEFRVLSFEYDESAALTERSPM